MAVSAHGFISHGFASDGFSSPGWKTILWGEYGVAEVRAAKASPRVAANFIVVLWGELFFLVGGSTGQGNCGCHVLND